MSFKAQQRLVQRAERRLETCSLQTVSHWNGLKQTWRSGWTPFRIIAAGLTTGFLIGRSEPLSAITGGRWIQIAGTMSEWFAIISTNLAAGLDEAVDDDADAPDPAAEAPAAAEPPLRAPAPAEAATELSER